MTLISNVTSRGDAVTSSLSGALSINEGNGEIVIRDGSTEVVRVDKTGFKYFDNSGTPRIALGQDGSGQQRILVYGQDGKPQILIGQDPKDGTPVIANTVPGVDVINELLQG